MTEARASPNPEATPTWETQPTGGCHGFIAAAGNMKLTLGYATFAAGQVLLYCYEQLGPQPPQLWRRYYTGKESAPATANDLCADAEEYLATFGNRRPVEDLSLDDFLMHLDTRLKNEFH